MLRGNRHMLIIFLAVFPFLFLAACVNSNQHHNACEVRSDTSNPLIVLLHGLGADPYDFNTLKTKLEKAFPEATVAALTSMAPFLTFVLPITAQAELCFQELSKTIPDLNHRPILLIGHSQGGLRSWELYNQYRDKLQVKGIVTLATPWEGAPGLEVDEALVEPLYFFNDAVESDVQRLCQVLDKDVEAFRRHFKYYYDENQSARAMPGISDLMPSSEFLSKVKQALAHEIIPILAVGAGQGDFGALLDQDIQPPLKALNDMYATVIVGKRYHTKEHDMFVPLDSQHGLNVFPKEGKHIKRLFIKDASHNGLALNRYPMSINKGKSILEHEEMFNQVITFAKDILKRYGQVAAAA